MKKLFIVLVTLFTVIVIIQLGFYWHAASSPQWKYAKKALECNSANYDLRFCVDLPIESRKDFTYTSWKPMPCINTATSFYNDTMRAGNCNKFKSNPARWGFYEVDADKAVPGDLMVFFRKKDGARHAGVYTMNSLLGPLCANTTINGVFVHFMPIKPLLAVKAGGFYSVRYYRYKK